VASDNNAKGAFAGEEGGGTKHPFPAYALNEAFQHDDEGERNGVAF
jgi:hypothetical protein